MHRLGLSTPTAQVLFVLVAAAATATVIGGPVATGWAEKGSTGWIVSALPFTLALPYVGLTTTIALIIMVGVVLS